MDAERTILAMATFRRETLTDRQIRRLFPLSNDIRLFR